MANYSIAEEYTLPSLGKVYEPNVNPNVKIRSMTTQEEMKRLAPSDKAYKNLCDVIDDCLVENPGISAYDMCLADYQFLLHKLRIVTYGAAYDTISKCPHCLSSNDNTIDLSEVPVKNYDNNDFAKLTSFKLPRSGNNITIKVQTPRMVDEVNSRVKELKKKSKNQAADPALLFTIAGLIDTIDGEKLDPVQREKFARELPMMDTNYIIKHAQKLVESFGLDLRLEFTCPICGLDYTSYFRVTSEFFGPSIHI
jgi:hypothetical protein